MTALDRHIDNMVNDRAPEEYGSFPKNESSWEELFELCTRLIAEIVTLRRAAAQQKMHPTLGKSAASDSESKPAPSG